MSLLWNHNNRNSTYVSKRYDLKNEFSYIGRPVCPIMNIIKYRVELLSLIVKNSNYQSNINLLALSNRLGRTTDFLVYGQGQQRRAIIEAVRLLDDENKGTNSEFCKLNEMPDVKSPNQFKDKSKKWLKFVTQV